MNIPHGLSEHTEHALAKNFEHIYLHGGLKFTNNCETNQNLLNICV